MLVRQTLVCWLLSFALLASGRAEGQGVVVEEVARGSSAEKAGLAPGDLLFSWVRPPSPPANPQEARGWIASGFDLLEVEAEEAPRGRVTLSGTRNRDAVSVELPSGEWGFRARPAMPEAILAHYEKGRTFAQVKDFESGLKAVREAADEAGRSGDPTLACWLRLRAADVLREARRWEPAREIAEVTIPAARELPERAVLARAWYAVAKALEGQNKLAEAAVAHGEVARIREEISPESLAFATALHNVGVTAYNRGDFTAAEDALRRSLALREKLAPGSLVVARSLTNLGSVADGRGDLTAAEEFHRRALAIFEAVAPRSVFQGWSLGNLGIVAIERGDLALAEELFGAALAIFRDRSPEDRDVAEALNNLALIALNRGDLATAESHLREAVALNEKIAPGSLDVASSLQNLGVVVEQQGDLDLAEDFYRRSLAIRERLAPGSTVLASVLNNMGGLASRRNDLETAKAYRKQALALWEELAPGSLDVANALESLGTIARTEGQQAEAAQLYRRAQAIYGAVAPGNVNLATILESLGDLARERGDLAGAEDLYKNALAIRERLAPGSAAVAESLHALGSTHRSDGRLGSAADFLCRAVDALESQRAKLGGTAEARSAFGARHAQYYHGCLDALIEQGRPEDAFHVLERSRARELLALLAERDLLFAADIPEELARESSRIDREYDRVQTDIALLNADKDKERIDQALINLRELRSRAQGVAARVRKLSPRLAALRDPQPFDLVRAREALDPGTTLLSYSVGKDKTYLFVVTAPSGPRSTSASARAGFSAVPIAVGREELQGRVERFRKEIERARALPEAASASVAAGRALFRDLVAPASLQIEASQRILVCPDGPLHLLPFAALVVDDPAGGARKRAARPRYLIEWKALHTVVSVTVYAELKKTRREGRAPVRLAAFGDPQYPAVSRDKAASVGNVALRSALRSGFELASIPGTREEVQAIAGFYPGRAVTYLGSQATEERAKVLGKDVGHIHFACHGILDKRFPLNSALALTIPEGPLEGQDNGLLQAWEIFEKVRIDADLVSLSACETALGQEMGGEGLLGLTRAFQYAGARSVLASLWSVSDRSTAELMKRFYRYLRDGRAKDEALRSAQMDLIRGSSRATANGPARAIGGLSAPGGAQNALPFHWAPFEIIGDWR